MEFLSRMYNGPEFNFSQKREGYFKKINWTNQVIMYVSFGCGLFEVVGHLGMMLTSCPP